MLFTKEQLQQPENLEQWGAKEDAEALKQLQQKEDAEALCGLYEKLQARDEDWKAQVKKMLEGLGNDLKDIDEYQEKNPLELPYLQNKKITAIRVRIKKYIEGMRSRDYETIK